MIFQIRGLVGSLTMTSLLQSY